MCMKKTNWYLNCVLDKLIVLVVVYVYAHGYIYGWLKVAIGICCLGKLAGGIIWLAAWFY